MDVLGEGAFWRGIREFLSTYRFKPVTTDQFFAVMSSSSGQDLDWFKRQWFYTEGVPVVRATIEGQTVRMAQEGAWLLDLPIWQYNGGKWDVKRVRVDGSGGVLRLSGTGPVLIDPERRVMAQVNGAPSFPADLAEEAYRNTESAAVRDALLASLGGLSGGAAWQLLEWEKVSTLRQRIAATIGTNSIELLLKLVDDRDRRIANAAIQRLGAGPNNPTVVERLREVMENDTNPRIRFSALASLYRTTNDAALIDLAWNTASPNEAFKTFALDNWQRTQPERVRQTCLDTLRTSTNTILRIDATRRLGQLKDAPGSRDVYNALVEIVREHGSNQPRIAAANALAQYGDKAAIEYLRPLANEGNTRFANAVRGPLGRLERAN
jgi:aminopeptidase N